MSQRCCPEILALKCTRVRSYAIYYFLLKFFLGIVLDDDLLMIADQTKKSHPLIQRTENANILPEKAADNIQDFMRQQCWPQYSSNLTHLLPLLVRNTLTDDSEGMKCSSFVGIQSSFSQIRSQPRRKHNIVCLETTAQWWWRHHLALYD